MELPSYFISLLHILSSSVQLILSLTQAFSSLLSLLRGFDHFMSRPLQCLVLCNEGLVPLHANSVLSRPYLCLALCNLCPSSLSCYCLVLLYLVHECSDQRSTYLTITQALQDNKEKCGGEQARDTNLELKLNAIYIFSFYLF